MKTFILFEGRSSNDNDMVRSFRKEARAIAAFNASTYLYAVVNEYDGVPGDEMANYRRTLKEKVS